jgi:dTDP-4-dehydrorhamnose reductase
VETGTYFDEPGRGANQDMSQFICDSAPLAAGGHGGLLYCPRGLYHLGGPERLSRRALLRAVLKEYRKSETPMAEVVECSLRDIPVLEPQPLDTSLRSDRFKADFGTPFRAASEAARAAVQSYFAAQDGEK